MTTIPASIRERLEKPFQLTSDQIQFYQKNRFIKLKQVFDEETISFFNDVISKQVALMHHDNTPLEQRSTYGKAFLQLFNLWREDDAVKTFIFSERLAKIATDLMNIDFEIDVREVMSAAIDMIIKNNFTNNNDNYAY